MRCEGVAIREVSELTLGHVAFWYHLSREVEGVLTASTLLMQPMCLFPLMHSVQAYRTGSQG